MANLKTKKNKRWGKKFVDKRNWPKTNEELVKCGEYLLDFGWVESWEDELEAMNKNKVGAPYKFPNSLIELQAVWHAKQMPCRMIEGMTRDLCKIGQIPEYNDYTTVNRRINQLSFGLDVPKGQSIIVFTDGSGMQAISGGEYMREKYGKQNRVWVQIIVLGDPITKEPVSYEINIIHESEADSAKEQAKELIKQGVNITALGGDGGLDQMKLWDFLQKEGIDPIIKPDKNAKEDTENELRNRHVKERNNVGYKKWAKKYNYGMRWPATEGIFSAIKRVFGEELHATSEKGLIQEASGKIWAYTKLRRYSRA